MNITHWPADHSDALTAHRASGKSFSLIALALNLQFGTTYTRSSCAGKISRLGLPGPETRERLPYKASPRPIPELRCVEIIPRGVAFDDLEPNDCRYPEGDGPFTFCGHPRQAGSSYCTPHHAICWSKPLPRQDRYLSRQAVAR